MTKRKHTARISLQRVAEAHLIDVLSGKWDGVFDFRGKPVSQWAEVIASIETQCPGFTHEEYVDAIIRANRDNR
jgi:hypothetical protein